jgi:branched-chain amino acid transport system permease protein
MTERTQNFVLLALVAAAAALLPLFAGSYWTSVGLELLMWVCLVQSWFMFSALTGYVSLGHVVFFGLGGYITAVLWGKTAIWIAVASGGGAAALLAIAVGLPCLRVRGPYFVMLTFGLAEFVKHMVINIETAVDSFGRVLIGAPDVRYLFWAMLAIAAAAFILANLVRFSKFGDGLRAIREEEVAAETIGIPVGRLKAIAFGLSAIVPGLAGGLMVMRAGSFDATYSFDPLISLTIICMAIIGGGDSPRGPLLGAVLLVILSELLWSRFPELYMVIVGITLMVFVLVLPSGLSSRISRRKKSPAPTAREVRI